MKEKCLLLYNSLKILQLKSPTLLTVHCLTLKHNKSIRQLTEQHVSNTVLDPALS
jgi:hypothetical protein